MTGWAWVHILAAASGLAVAVLAATRSGSTRLGLPLALLSVDQFAWNAASVGTALTHDPGYARVGAIAAPLFVPPALHFVLRFVGRRHALRRVLLGVYVVFGLEAVLAAVDAVVPLGSGGISTFSAVLLVTGLPVGAFAVALVLRHLDRASSAIERWRSRLVLLALAVVTALICTDLLADLGLPVPRLANLGSFVFNIILSFLTLHLGLFPEATGRTAALFQALLLGLFAAVVYLNVFMYFGDRLGLFLISSTVLTLLLVAAGWVVVTSGARARSGLERFATLGRFSSQMAHDLKNPLAAARGAAQYLAEEMRTLGRPEHLEFAQLVVGQLDRLGAVIERYQRLSKLVPERTALDLNALVTRVLSLQAFAAGAVEWKRELREGPLPVLADADLLASALENLVKNALEAMPGGGVLTVSTAVLDDDDQHVAVLTVRDTGAGMDARAREQAFELFFTTKAGGTGLGLPFVRQVAQAHGGAVLLRSEEGAGTSVEVRLPLAPVASPA